MSACMSPTSSAATASVNGVALNAQGSPLSTEELRQRACSELLRQAAVSNGLLDPADPGMAAGDGILSAAATLAIEQLLEQTLIIPQASEEECRRHYVAHRASYASGERVHVRHILLAVTPGVDVAALRTRAEAMLLDVRCHDGGADAAAAFAEQARQFSNCPSGARGGDLGWLTTADCAPEFARELFGQREVGVLPRLVHSRFGFHVVDVVERRPGVERSFEAVHGAVTMALRQKTYVTALRQYLAQLAGQAQIVGVDIEAAETPLAQ